MKANVVVIVVVVIVGVIPSGTVLSIAWIMRIEDDGRELSRWVLRRGNVTGIVVVIIRVVREGHLETILFDDDFIRACMKMSHVTQPLIVLNC